MDKKQFALSLDDERFTMKVVQCNIVVGRGSTGHICLEISKLMDANNIENYILYSIGSSDFSNAIKCTQPFSKFQSLKSRIIGNYGFNSKKTTLRMIDELERIQPDVVVLHNMHGHNCHLELLSEYFRKKQTKLIWTFHDCWTFTGYCPHYTMEKCDKWKSGCYECTQYRKFSWFIDKSAELYKRKRACFEGLNLTIVTPSQWLADQVKQSFLQNNTLRVINNGIDVSIFKPVQNNFREKFDIQNKFILLGVAIQWVPRKGADVFIRLAEKLPSDKFQIVLVGTDKNIDRQLPSNIISIHRTENQQQLAEIYTAADLFVNPTREENFPTVNIEAIACGTPVLTYRTGGSPEIIDSKTGAVVDCDDENALLNEILRIEKERPFSPEDCIARASKFSDKLKYAEYIQLFDEVINK